MSLVELILSALLLSVVLLAFGSLYVASHRFHYTANDKSVIGSELQYAMQHIYKYAMQAIGDEGSAPIDVSVADTVSLTLNNNDPLTSGNYGSTVTYVYRKNGALLEFYDGSTWESLVPRIDITAVTFSLVGATSEKNVLSISLTGQYNDEQFTLHSACYPRLASFQ